MDDKQIESKLSIGIPVYNEQENVQELVYRITDSMKNASIQNYEIVFTDNHSTDMTMDVLKKLSYDYPDKIKILRHARNYGYQTSILTCLENCDGDYVAIIDGDLQDPPEHLPNMLSLAKSNDANIVYGVRKSRKEKFWKILAYKLFYKLWNKVADIEIQIDSGEFAIYDRFSVNQILKFKEKNRFQRGIRAYLGLKQLPYYYDRELRSNGISKFNINQQIKLGLDGMYSFSLAPIRFIMAIGLSVFTVSSILTLISVILKVINFFNPSFSLGQMGQGLVLIFFVTTMLFGVTIIILGILGEYLGRIFDEIRNRPVIIDTTIENRNETS